MDHARRDELAPRARADQVTASGRAPGRGGRLASPGDEPSRWHDAAMDHLIAPSALAQQLAAADEAYIREHFVPLTELAAGRLDEVRAAIADGRLPVPAYVLDDGTEMVGADHLALLDEPDPRAVFVARYEAAGGDEDEAWEDYLGGVYAVCLRSPTPESIARKGQLMVAIQGLLDAPAPDDDAWRTALREAIDELDGLERPFAPLDEHRLGARPSRRRLIDDPRAKWAWLVEEPAAAT